MKYANNHAAYFNIRVNMVKWRMLYLPDYIYWIQLTGRMDLFQAWAFMQPGNKV